MLKIMITDIEWDTDGEVVDLPAEHELCCEVAIADELSELYGWCIKSFCVNIDQSDFGYTAGTVDLEAKGDGINKDEERMQQ